MADSDGYKAVKGEHKLHVDGSVCANCYLLSLEVLKLQLIIKKQANLIDVPRQF